MSDVNKINIEQIILDYMDFDISCEGQLSEVCSFIKNTIEKRTEHMTKILNDFINTNHVLKVVSPNGYSIQVSDIDRVFLSDAFNHKWINQAKFQFDIHFRIYQNHTSSRTSKLIASLNIPSENDENYMVNKLMIYQKDLEYLIRSLYSNISDEDDISAIILKYIL